MASAITEAEDLSWMEDVRKKLITVFQNREEDLCRILFFLDQEDAGYKGDPVRPYCPHWKSLKATLNSDRAFEMLAKRLSDDTKRAEKDPAFRLRMNKVYEEQLKFNEKSCGKGQNQCFHVARLHDSKLMRATVSREAIKAYLDMALSSRNLVSSVDEAVSLVSKNAGTIVMVALAAVHLTYKAYNSIRRWWKGEISGKRCVKNIVDDLVAIGGAVGGGLAGAALGTVIAGPVGTAVGGIVGGIAVGAVANCLSDRLTQFLFNLPKTEALEKAYNYLEVKQSASNSEVNTVFHQRCLQHHPDKGGDKEEFIVLQSHMAVIRQARGEF